MRKATGTFKFVNIQTNGGMLITANDGSISDSEGESTSGDWCFHDVQELASHLEASDSVQPHEFYNDLHTRPNGDIVGSYQRLREATVRLSTLEAAYERGDYKMAIRLLSQRSRLDIDEKYFVDIEDPRYFLSCDETYLDFILVVGDQPGIDMFIPNTDVNHHFALELDLRLHIKRFTPKKGVLGFDPTGAMLCIGQTPVQNLWLAMAPYSYFENDDRPFNLSKGYGDTFMDKHHRRILHIFLGKMLQSLPGSDFVSWPLDPEDLWVNDEQVFQGHSNM
jgi:hypothetical protein